MRSIPAAALLLGAASATADPLALRADALATTQAPAGLLVLDGGAQTAGSLVSAEAIVWTAASPVPGQHDGDVLVMALRAHTADGRARTTVGRFVETLGALRPLQLDGADGRIALPGQFDAEAFAGVPVVPGLMTSRAFDWAVGGRVARRLGEIGSIGVAMLEQRDDGRLATEEVALDAGAALGAHTDAGARAAYDLANPALAELSATASHRWKAVRGELYGGYTAASHLLPATSLFTVLGDIPSERGGAVVTWLAAPRLDVVGDLGARRIDRTTLPAVALRARLALDDRGKGALTGELRRDGASDDPWTGARGAARIALPHALTAAVEVELVVPDDARGRGRLWPWALGALAWDHGPWHAAVAVEASASPEDEHRVDVLGQLGRMWGSP